MRLVAILAGAVFLWLVTAMQVPSHERLPIDPDVFLGS